MVDENLNDVNISSQMLRKWVTEWAEGNGLWNINESLLFVLIQEAGVESMGPLSEGQGEVHAEPALTQSTVLTDTSTEPTHPPDPPQVWTYAFLISFFLT